MRMQERGVRFAEWLMGRPEKQIAVVSHSGFIHAFFQNFGGEFDHQVAQHMHRCEWGTSGGMLAVYRLTGNWTHV